MIPLDMSRCKIGLALSGGGVRAAAFHAGVLRWFAEKDLLEKIEHVSTVSGGSLFIGLLFQMSDYKWPDKKRYLADVLPNVRRLLTTKSLQRDAVCRFLLNPINWCLLISRANVFAKCIEHLWGISATIGNLPTRPVWSINGTTAENGRRFRFKNKSMGDYEIGYADANKFKLAAAMAVSAALPGSIGPLRVDATRYQWHSHEKWGSSHPVKSELPKYRTLHLYDGGIYDNLGIEPLFDIGKQQMKDNIQESINFLVVSDAGARYQRGVIPVPFSPCRLKRVLDVTTDQTRALRVRSFVNYLIQNPCKGMYLQIGLNPHRCIDQHVNGEISTLERSKDWLSTEDIVFSAEYKTTLSRISERSFDLISRHGYETALVNELVFLSSLTVS